MPTFLTKVLSRAGHMPVEAILPQLAEALDTDRAVVLVAPPGTGKTTVVPLALLESPWRGDKRIIMLEPRRVAARAAARRMAWLLEEKVGETVGFRIRNETVVSSRTRIEVVTEGVLTRMLQGDPALEEYGLVIFDEFHERNLHGDVGLALTLQARDLVREDLRLLVMSATLDTAALVRTLGNAPIIRTEGKSYDVRLVYHPPRSGQRVEGAIYGAIKRAFTENEGDVLAFLPGIAEISRTARDLEGDAELKGADVLVLHSSTPAELQDAALAPARAGRRKIVLATSIAETSVTIDGVRAVVDSGLSRVPRYSPATALTRLETVRVSRASAEQRAGRAGRTAPGVCYRVWDEHEQHSLLDRWLPEIMDADLVPLVLDLAAAGVHDPKELRWIDAPPHAAISTARQLLRQLGALDSDDRVTAHGREMNRLALHPRLAHMVVAARSLRLMPLACDVAALLEERDILREGREQDVDLRTRVQILNRWRQQGARGQPPRSNVDAGALNRALREADRLRKAVRAGDVAADERATGLLLAFAYPDRIALRREVVSSRFLMRNGAGAALPSQQELSGSEAIVVAELDGRRPESRIWLAAPIDVEDIVSHFGEQIVTDTVHEWDDESASVRQVRRERLGALVLRETRAAPTDPIEAAQILAELIIESNLRLLPWNAASRQLLDRIAFVRTHNPDWPDLSEAALIAGAGEWLTNNLVGLRALGDVKRLDMVSIISAMLDWRQREELEELAPTHLVVPTGSRIALDYSDPEAPMIAVRLQEVFGLADTPRLVGGRVPVTMQLLSPAQRPVQVTRDLSSFWRTSYFEVRKEMRGRYPRHHWPENPLEAEPTRRAKRKGTR